MIARNPPTWNTESNADFEKPENRPPLPRERAGVRGESQHKTKARHHPLLTTQNNERKLEYRF
ncbi:hypothetical protein RS3R6_49550 [Pseudomonas atacamensis]|uniref:Uncharacterized protein n=1 Tax=Pseudomonas atacamensis TaxID=2565368 RepID=A0ABQ5PR65_9PSED|nr:hypothetical protein RS3R1_50920 [Pseudomonas atacamensis]GLH56773.1 hypothetical protein RS3R6_49550 [Pseudomonas atacamensis]